MKELDTYIIEKLKLNKDTKDENPENDAFVKDLMKLCGMRTTSNESVFNIIKDALYKYKITEDNIEIYCNDIVSLHNRYNEIKFNSENNKYVSKIIFGYMSKSILNPNGIVFSTHLFKIKEINNGFIVIYQKYNDNYKIYITKK